ncbi:MAG TPA: cytochrome c3 family protein [Candidatus Deferrimicrobium sp.]|nr:cytochrome c3 family protein [Candidatus Deferrimicrobium sp.]
MRDASVHITRELGALLAVILPAFCLFAAPVDATDVITNGTFNTNLTGWSTRTVTSNGTRAWDNTIYGAAAGSMRYRTNTGRNLEFAAVDSQYIPTVIDPTDTVYLSLYWYKYSAALAANLDSIIVSVIRPNATEAILWSEGSRPGVNQSLSGNVTQLNVSSSFTLSGNYYIKIYGRVRTGNNSSAYVQLNVDDIVLDVRKPPVNNAPQVTAGATTAAPASVNRIGSGTTTLSANFSDADQPAVSAFTVSFRVREPDNATVVNVAVNSGNGQNGVTITSLGGGNYQATVNWDPPGTATRGAYDLRFEVSDGIASASDDYVNNLNELTVYSQSAPSIASGVTTASPVTVNRIGTDSTRLSATWSDADSQPIDSFWVTFSVRKPDNTTQILVVDSLKNGSGGLVVIDNANGTYTGYVDWNPADGETIDLYDLRCRVFDGTSAVEDGYTGNLNELTVESQSAPTMTAGVTSVSPVTVNRIGTDSTRLSATWSDQDGQPVTSFWVTFSVREPNNSSQVVVVDSSVNGANGLTVIDNANGTYTAYVDWNPNDGQTTGSYDLRCRVFDGTSAGEDGYASNLDELTVESISANIPPAVVAGATQVTTSPVNRQGTSTTTIFTSFTDANQPGVGAFLVTFKVRRPDNVTEDVLVNNQPNGSGVTITDNGGGSYTAQYLWDPSASQEIGFYDLYFLVSDDSSATATDGFANNLNELEVVDAPLNNAPAVAQGATALSASAVNRIGSNSTNMYANFSDNDIPGVNAFTVTFKIREPNNTTEVTLVNNQPNGAGGVTITSLGGNGYRAQYSYNPADNQTLGLYDLYFSVSDGQASAEDLYDDNLDELQIYEAIANNPPVIVAGATAVAPSSVDRLGSATTTFGVTFTDADQPAVNTFAVVFKARAPYSVITYTVADSLANGQGGLTIVANGGGSYTASIAWNPPDDAVLGNYDLYASVFDGQAWGTDDFANNTDQLLITSGGENHPPVVPADAVFASPAGVERIGANSTTLAATFSDTDIPGIAVFRVSFKLRAPNDVTEIVLANNAAHGAGGVSIVDGGGGVYTASINWDAPDAQTLGFYDLYFHVTDGADTSYDGFSNNLDELEVYDAITNQSPTLAAGNTTVIPDSINRVGTSFTMIKSTFSDADVPGRGAFTVTIKVRDASSVEYTVVNAARHDQQGLRIKHVSGAQYEASVLWDPGAAQPTGLYDLYISVQDNAGAIATDSYTSNTDELTVFSAAILGDGNLLHRNNDAATCGGPNAACHNLPDHQSQDCRVCHTPHSTANVYLVRDSILTPNSGKKKVVFKTLGIGDPYNAPDPTPGDPTSGVMADSTDGVFTGVCEVCHTTTGHHRNNGTQLPPNHHDAEDCTTCHPHSDAFAVSGGGESSGGDGCSCHSTIVPQMKDNTATSYHHLILSENASYTTSSRTCLMCHVHHDIFRPDLNTGVGQRAKNLRVDTTTAVVQGDANVLLNSDYRSTGTGGICLSCHAAIRTKSYTQPDGTTQTPALSKTNFDAATLTHNYNVSSTFSTDGSLFNANCVKCHNDNMSKSFQSAGNKFGTHDGDYRRILTAAGIASPTDPLEEKFCFQCHSTTSNPNAGTNKDYYNVKAMSANSLKIQSLYSYTYKHPTTTYSGRHKPIEAASDLADGNRHAECADCHDPHSVQQGIHDGSTNLVSNALKGTWGVEPTSWPAKPVPTNNGNVFATPASYNRVEPAQKEYQICLKCHSNYTTLPSGARNLAQEINPNYPSMHGIVQAGTNTYCNTTTMNAPWGTSKIAWCSDCHGSNSSTDPSGPHGSNLDHLLVATVTSDATNGTPLCTVCHKYAVYWNGSSAASRDPDHPATQGAHRLAKGCFSCHMWDYASTAGLGVQTTDDLAAGAIYVHGMNKKWVYYEVDGTAGTGQDADCFVSGYIANIDFTGRRCWAETCKNHSAKAY